MMSSETALPQQKRNIDWIVQEVARRWKACSVWPMRNGCPSMIGPDASQWCDACVVRAITDAATADQGPARVFTRKYCRRTAVRSTDGA